MKKAWTLYFNTRHACCVAVDCDIGSAVILC